MNKERILMLADLIEQQPHTCYSDELGFNLSCYLHECGTPSCIAGWAAWEALKRPLYITLGQDEVIEIASTYLELEDDQEDLFCGSGRIDMLSQVTPQQTAKALREFAETGVVPAFFRNMAV